MNKLNALIDKLIYIKDGLSSRAEKDIINEACSELKRLDLLAQNGQSAIDTNKRITDKIERGELVKVVRCKDCENCVKRNNTFECEYFTDSDYGNYEVEEYGYCHNGIKKEQ